MSIEVNIDAEAVQQQVVEAIVNGALGAKIKTAVDQALRPQFSGRGSVVDDAVAAEVHEQVRTACRLLVREDGPIKDAIQTKLREALSDEALDKIVARFVHDLGLITIEDMRDR